MKLLDVNVILAAHRDDHPNFDFARPWLDDTLLATGAPFSIVDLVAGSFLRLATNRRIFAIPTPVGEAFSYLKALRAQPGHLLLTPGPEHLSLLEQVCDSAEASGDLVAVAQLAAIAIEHGCELISFDRDFARFPALRWSRPSTMTVPMPSEENPLQGGCLCGAVRYEVTAPFLNSGYCHCTHCQRRSGTGSSVNARAPQEGFRLLQGEESLRSYTPPTGRPKVFCSQCGSALFSGEPLTDAHVSIRLGTLDSDPGIRPEYRQYIDSACAWETIPQDGLTRYPGSRPF